MRNGSSPPGLGRIAVGGFAGLAATVLVAAIGPFLSGASARAEETALERLRTDVQTLSAPEFEGRGAGTEGLSRALDYLEKGFRDAGLEPQRQTFQDAHGAEWVNLVAVLGDSASKRHVILGAHYDHLGFGEAGTPNAGKLHPGADDNASGVAVLLECARRLAEEAALPHAVVFLAFAGEESGLLGSAHYGATPLLPLEECTAMVNLDTVGRLSTGSLTIFGVNTAVELAEVLRGVNYGFHLPLELPESDPGGSDQMSFVQRGVPAVQLFTGAHADYHRPSDTPDKIDIEGLEKIVGFTTELLLYLAGRDEPLTFLPPGAEKATAQAPAGGGGGGRRVSFGSIPDFNHTGKGVLLSGVIPGSPAEKAGLRQGDVIVEFAGVAVDDLRGYSDVLKTLNPGDEAEVVFLRDGERQRAVVTVVERK